MGKVLRFGANGVTEESSEVVSAGAPQKPAADVPALTAQLNVLADNALIASNRLTNLVDATKAPEVVQKLIERYGVLSTKIAGLYNRVGKLTDRPDDAAALIRDGESTSIEIQGFIEAVEELVAKYPRTDLASNGKSNGGAAPSSGGSAVTRTGAKRDLAPFFILGGIAVLVAGGGYLIWAQKQKQDKAVARASSRAFGALPARGGKTKTKR